MYAGTLIATILRHDRKIASYKIALIRSLNDLALGYAHLGENGALLAVPLRSLAAFWVAYYWPFVSAAQPIEQGIHPANKQDISFRPALTQLRQAWEQVIGGSALASDGFYLVGEFQSAHRRNNYPAELTAAYDRTIRDIADAIQQPVRYAGPGQYSVFEPPKMWKDLQSTSLHIVCIPGTRPNERCLVVDAELWASFNDLSMWIEALCIHEWSLFTEGVSGLDRGIVYALLTDRPGNRRPLTWERNQVEILMMEGHIFECPWTGKRLNTQSYDLDHLLPLSAYPINELWNLVPADADFNRKKKRDRLPGQEALHAAQPRLATVYHHYIASPPLATVLQHDALMRFSGKVVAADLPGSLAACATQFIQTIASVRNLASF
ncbi:MAG TPA: HNH endonuclease signature motif containing protein [Anaerolineales bacterium]|nr:HNH endonuclease signature motif containing protein [Anaerolineales bacterium]